MLRTVTPHQQGDNALFSRNNDFLQPAFLLSKVLWCLPSLISKKIADPALAILAAQDLREVRAKYLLVQGRQSLVSKRRKPSVSRQNTWVKILQM